MIVEIVVDNDDFVIVRLEERVKYLLMPGYYLKNAKGYWYEIHLEWGELTRVKHAGPSRRLEEALDAALKCLGLL